MKILNLLIDFIFPPSVDTLRLRLLHPENIFSELPKAPSPPFPFITSLFAYKNPLVSEMIWSIKYKKHKHSIELGGFALYNELRKLSSEKIILIPIPISSKRRKQRGYNQCELLIDEILRLDKDNKFHKSFNLLVREKDTDRQTLKNRQQRIEGVIDLFKIEGEIDKVQTLVIIDDVTTTGSTLKQALETLKSAGYENVSSMTVAH